MQRYDSFEEEFKVEFKNLKSSFYMILTVVNMGVALISYLSDVWLFLAGSLISSFFIFLMLIPALNKSLLYFISKYK